MIIVSILLIIISNAVSLSLSIYDKLGLVKRRDISLIFNRIAIMTLILCILKEINSLFIKNDDIGLHGGLLYTTNITQTFHIFTLIISILIIQLTSFNPNKILIENINVVKWALYLKNIFDILILVDYYGLEYIEKNTNSKKKTELNIRSNYIELSNIISNIRRSFIKNKYLTSYMDIMTNEYPLIILFVITGAIFLISTNDLVSIFLSIELQSYGLYLLSTIYRNSELSTTGGLIYFLLGGLSSCFILLGISLIYSNSGTTSLDGLYVITSISEVSDINSWYKSYYVNFSLLIFTIGFLFKVSAAPFHFWSPDVYDAIPTIVTTFVAIIAKISIFILLLQLVYYINNNFLEISWTYGILISSFLSLIVGTVVGLTQFRIKRLYAYSTISHVGFILLSLSICSVESLQAFLFYLMQYTISNLNAFIILIAIGFNLQIYKNSKKIHKELKDKINSPIQLISQLKGYFYINPFMALSSSITLFSFAGIPPLMGFFAKQQVLSAALDKGYIFLSLVAIITSVIGAGYYLNIIKEMFFYKSINQLNNWFKESIFNYALKKNNNNLSTIITINSFISFSISIITLIILLYIFVNIYSLSLCVTLTQSLYNT